MDKAHHNLWYGDSYLCNWYILVGDFAWFSKAIQLIYLQLVFLKVMCYEQGNASVH